jgi:hypothetical protein
MGMIRRDNSPAKLCAGRVEKKAKPAGSTYPQLRHSHAALFPTRYESAKLL